MSLISTKKAPPTTPPALSVTFKRDSPGRVILCAIGIFSSARDALAAMWTSELKPGHGRILTRCGPV